MLCPEVWKFSPPASNYREQKRNLITDKQKVDKNFTNPVNDFYYTHLVSIVLPNITELPNDLTQILCGDSDYYKVENLLLSDLLRPEFIDNFVKKGNLTALSINTKIDVDNCVCVTPKGILILSLDKVSFQKLGLEGEVSHFANRSKERYIVKLDLLNLTKSLQKHATNSLRDRLHKFTLILSWDPPESTVCPSSIAKYLNDLSYDVFVCTPKFQTRNTKYIRVPILLENDTNFCGFDMFEWLGLFCVEADLESGGCDDQFLSTYQVPEENIICKNVIYFESRGLFTVKKLQQIFEYLKNYVQTLQINIPWISFYAQGFSDAPVIWNLVENHYFTNSENAYAFFFKQDGNCLICTQSCSNKRHN